MEINDIITNHCNSMMELLRQHKDDDFKDQMQSLFCVRESERGHYKKRTE